MEREINEIKRELEHLQYSVAYALSERDEKGVKFLSGYEYGLARALEILAGGDAFIDSEVNAWWAANQ